VELAAGKGEKGYTSRPKFSEKKLRYFWKIPTSQGIPNFVKAEKEQRNPGSSSKSSEELFFRILS
jgi:hypothetical protein